MKKTLFIPFILFLLILSHQVDAKADHFYEIELNYDQGKLSYSSIVVKPVTSQEYIEDTAGGYVAEVVAFNETRLDAVFFDIPLEIIYDKVSPGTGEIVGGGIIELEQSNTNIRIPYYENAKEINIYDININKLLTIDISSYSKNRCGDNLCQLPESYKTCRQDCLSGSENDFCDELRDNRCDPDCNEQNDVDCKESQEPIEKEIDIQSKLEQNWQVILLLIIVLVVVLFFILKSKNK